VNLRGCSFGVGNDDEGVYFEVCELTVDVDSVQSRDEVNEDIMNALWNLLQESCGKLFVRGVFRKVDWDEDLLSFGINITNIDTALVCEENPVTLNRWVQVSTWHVKDRRFIGGRIEDGVEQKAGPTWAKGADSGNDQAHADAGTKLHVDSIGFVRDVGHLKYAL
jgi:hypothetical protein